MAKRIVFVKGADGALKTGLTLAWHELYKVSDGSSIPAIDRPAFTEIGNGLYSTDPDTLIAAEGDIVGVIDTTLTTTDQYRPFYATTQDNDQTVVTAPSGTNAVAIVTAEADTTRIPNVLVEVVNASGSVIRTITTDANGDASVNLEDGTYTFRGTRAMVNLTDEVQVISGADTVTITGSVISVSSPASGFQTVYGYIYQADGTPAEGATLRFKLKTVPQMTSDDAALITANEIESDAADSLGYVEIQVPKEASGVFRASESNSNVSSMDRVVSITDDDTRPLSTYAS